MRWKHDKSHAPSSAKCAEVAPLPLPICAKPDTPISPRNFYNKHMIALKEAEETKGWLKLLRETNALTELEHTSMEKDCQEMPRLVVATIKTLKGWLS